VRKKGFTLMELLVVISIIALLMSILMPTLGKAKKQARSTVCMVNIKQWATIFASYAAENKDKFPYESFDASTGIADYWMSVLENYYGNQGDFRCCPEATKNRWGQRPEDIFDPLYDATSDWPSRLPYGNAEATWGPNLTSMGYKYTDYGSYGINLWTSPIAWTGAPEIHWENMNAKDAWNIPVIMDCSSAGAMPATGTESKNFPDKIWGWVGACAAPSPVRDAMKQDQYIKDTGPYNMYRILMDRHNMAINMSFMDCSARRVPLRGRELWQLKCNKASTPNHNIKMPEWLE